MEKIQAVTPQEYFTILRDLDFFSDDKLGIQESFYVVPDVPATGEDSSFIVSSARNEFEDFSFCSDLREKIGRSGTVGDTRVEPRNLTLLSEVPMDVEPDTQEQDLRSKITGKPVPGPSAPSDASNATFASGDIRFKSAEELATSKQKLEKWQKKMKEKHRKNMLSDKLEEYERKIPTDSSGARKASADHSPEERGRKRERSSSIYTTCCESVSPRRRSRPARELPHLYKTLNVQQVMYNTLIVQHMNVQHLEYTTHGFTTT